MDDIFNIIVDNMITAQKMGTIDKKEYVMNMLKHHLKTDTYERYEPFISLTIDGLKYISKNIDVLKELSKNNCRCVIV